jgi:alkylhydroperoxidase family enzyme
MTRIPMLHEDDAALPADAKAFLTEASRARGQVLNIYRAMANRPAAGRGFVGIADAVYRKGSSLSPRHAELAYLTATAVNNCHY